MSNGIKDIAGEVGFVALVSRTRYVVCEPTDEGARRLSDVVDESRHGAVAIEGLKNRTDGGAYVRLETGYQAHHNRHVYLHAGQARVRADGYRTRLMTKPADGIVLRVEYEILEPEGMDLEASYQFAETMIQVWAQRAEERRARILAKEPAPKTRTRKPAPINPLTGRRLTRKEQKLARDREQALARTDLDKAERAFMIGHNLHTATAQEIRSRMITDTLGALPQPRAALYARNVGGETQVFLRRTDGSEIQLTAAERELVEAHMPCTHRWVHLEPEDQDVCNRCGVVRQNGGSGSSGGGVAVIAARTITGDGALVGPVISISEHPELRTTCLSCGDTVGVCECQ